MFEALIQFSTRVVHRLCPSDGCIAIHAPVPADFAMRLDLGGMQQRMPASYRLARMIGDWYLREIEKQPNEVQTT
jgi:hypothetical protein